MTQYISANVNLTDNQLQKLRQSVNANCAATSIKIGADDLDGDHTIFLTKAQINKLENARGRGKGLTIRMSSKQLKHNVKTQGGFLGALLPMLAGVGRMVAPALLGVAKKAVPALATGALSGLASTGVSKLFGNGLYLKKGGMIAQVETDGQGVYLRPYKGKGLGSRGNGLYLKQGKRITDGSGILTSIPIIGDILPDSLTKKRISLQNGVYLTDTLNMIIVLTNNSTENIRIPKLTTLCLVCYNKL